jgi:hypothetical protein
MQLVQGDGRHFRLIALYETALELPDLADIPGALDCLWNQRTADQLTAAPGRAAGLR